MADGALIWLTYSELWAQHQVKRGDLDLWVVARRVRQDARDGQQVYCLNDMLDLQLVFLANETERALGGTGSDLRKRIEAEAKKNNPDSNWNPLPPKPKGSG